MEFSTEYLTPQDDFFKDLIKKINTPPDIYLFDFDNEHGKVMYNLLKNPLYSSLQALNVIWKKLNTLEDFARELHELNLEENHYIILCIPFSWELQNDPVDIDIIESLYSISSANTCIIIAAGDENFNETFQNCAVIADKYIEWGTNFDEHDETATGTSAYTAFLTILAIGGNGYVRQKKENKDKFL